MHHEQQKSAVTIGIRPQELQQQEFSQTHRGRSPLRGCNLPDQPQVVLRCGNCPASQPHINARPSCCCGEPALCCSIAWLAAPGFSRAAQRLQQRAAILCYSSKGQRQHRSATSSVLLPPPLPPLHRLQRLRQAATADADADARYTARSVLPLGVCLVPKGQSGLPKQSAGSPEHSAGSREWSSGSGGSSGAAAVDPQQPGHAAYGADCRESGHDAGVGRVGGARATHNPVGGRLPGALPPGTAVARPGQTAGCTQQLACGGERCAAPPRTALPWRSASLLLRALPPAMQLLPCCSCVLCLAARLPSLVLACPCCRWFR